MRFASRTSLLLVGSLCAAASAQTVTRFTAYSECRFGDDLALAENTPLARGIEGRTVTTIMGTRHVPLAAGVRLMYAYPGTEPLANVKVEQIPADGYPQAKQDLIANFQQILTGDDSSTRNYALKPRLNGLEIYGLDRNKLEGGVLGIYLFFVDRTHTAATVYFLNQDPALRKFGSLKEYAALRDSFLETYTACAAGHAQHAAETAKTGPPEEQPAAAQAVGTPQSAAAAENPAAAESTTTGPNAPAALPDAPLPQGAVAQDAAAATPAHASETAAAKPKAAARKKPAARAKAVPAKKKKAVAAKKPVKKKKP